MSDFSFQFESNVKIVETLLTPTLSGLELIESWNFFDGWRAKFERIYKIYKHLHKQEDIFLTFLFLETSYQ